MACELQNIMLVSHKENFHILYQEKEKKEDDSMVWAEKSL